MGDSLVLRDISKSYWRGAQRFKVLEEVSLDVRPCEIVAVVGSQDDGKTTLLKVAAGIERPEEGAVRFGELDLATLSGRERERLLGGVIAWVNRERPGLDWRMLDYVGLPLTMGRGRGKARGLAAAALERVGAEGCAACRWGELSNWERMLVGLARGMVCAPKFLILDELFDGFGMRRSEEAGDLLRSLVEEARCGVLMSATGFEAALSADRVFSLGRGRLKVMSDQAGTNADVIAFPGMADRAPRSRGLGA
jgi:ABC-type nitrate/sulfonate/bicarbonate transport system ATPase subunit